MIEVVEGFWVNPHAVTVVKDAGKTKCALFVTGQSALEGFVLDYPADEVAEAVTDALNNYEYDEEEEG